MTQEDDLRLITKALRRLDPSFKAHAYASPGNTKKRKRAKMRRRERIAAWKEAHPEAVRRHHRNWRRKHKKEWNEYQRLLMRKRRAESAVC